MHWCFNCFSQIPNWVKLKFGQQVNKDIIFLQKNFRETHIIVFGFMNKFVKEVATGNEFATNFAVPVSVRSTCASSQRQRKIK
jgi:hypothetical protein